MPRKKITPKEAIDILKTFCSSSHKDGEHCPLICELCPIKDSCTTCHPELDQNLGIALPLFCAPNSVDKDLERSAKILKNLCYNTFCPGATTPFIEDGRVYKRCILGRECFVNGGDQPTTVLWLLTWSSLTTGESHTLKKWNFC